MITLRDDGTYVITLNDMPYHVIESDTDIWEEVQTRIEEGEEVVDEVPIQPGDDYEYDEETNTWALTLEGAQELYRTKVHALRDTMKYSGELTYKDLTVSTNEESTTNLNSYMTLASLGTLTYPILWRSEENEYISIDTVDELTELAGMFNDYVASCYSASWTTKDSLLSATTADECETLYEEFVTTISSI